MFMDMKRMALQQTPPADGPVLRDIHLPVTSWWPPAPGWWLLAAALLSALAYACWRAWHRRRAIERALQAEVDALQPLRNDPPALAAALHSLLRRSVLRFDPHAATLRGTEWRAQLARVRVDTATLDQLTGLEHAMYQPQAPVDVDAALNATRRWLRLAWRKGGKPHA